MDLLSGQVDARSVPSAPVFFERYARPNLPVVFCDATAKWRARSLWTLDWLKETHGHLVVSEQFPKSLAQVIEEAQAAIQATPRLDGEARYGRPQYAVEITRVQSLRADFAFPKFYLLERLCRIQLWFGPAGTRTNLHYDLCENLFAQLDGRKRFQLYPPSAIPCFAPLNHFPLFAEVRDDIANRSLPVEEVIATDPIKPVLDLVLYPGDMLFIPYRWLHRVTSLETQRSLSFRWLTLPMATHRLPALGLNWLRSTLSAILASRSQRAFRSG